MSARLTARQIALVAKPKPKPMHLHQVATGSHNRPCSSQADDEYNCCVTKGVTCPDCKATDEYAERADREARRDARIEQGRNEQATIREGDPGSWEVVCGDMRSELAKIPEGSADSVVCDPPYGLNEHPLEVIVECLRAWIAGEEFKPKGSGFMNKGWDAWVPGPEAWRAAFRVLKPGGYLVAFAGARTHDLMTLAIRLAGFEIRDSLAWMYGEGYPKSLNISKAIDEGFFTEWLVERRPFAKRFAHRLWVAGPDEKTSNGKRRSWAWRWCQLAEARFGPLIGKRGILGFRPYTGKDFSDPQFTEQGSMMRTGATAPRVDIPVTAPATPEAEEWEGYGTGLKPSYEPIILARKPLEEETLADQVLATGSGGLNIDACKVGNRVQTVTRGRHVDRSVFGSYQGDDEIQKVTLSGGRWPPNVVMSHLDNCRPIGTKRVKATGSDVSGEEPSHTAIFGNAVGRPSFKAHGDGDGFETIEVWACVPGCLVAELDRQSGRSKSSDRPRFNTAAAQANTVAMGSTSRDWVTGGHSDEGGASRFFPQFSPDPGFPFQYVHKPSRKEKDAGLDHLPQSTGGEATGRKDGSAGTKNARAGAGRTGGARNWHPTVKPVALMEWLIRLVTPEGGVVVDPFLGSASTGVAAIRAGFRFFGVEFEADHMPIAVGRCIHAAKIDPHNLPLFASIKPVPRKGGLFGEVNA
jgi:DNA modification methylase